MSALVTLPGAKAIDAGADLDRILALPARPAASTADAAAWSRLLCPKGSGALRLPQCESLREAHAMRGLVGPQRVGSGKTLETLLLTHVLGAERPVLIIPASLRDKTRAEFAGYHRAGWLVRCPRLVSYDELGRPDRAGMLADLDPDLLILDEAHRASNRDAASTRRIERFILAKRAEERGANLGHGSLLVVAVLSGTLIGDDLMSYHHLLVWALGPNAPVPLLTTTAERWATAIDKRTAILKRALPGRLAELPGGFHEHLRSRRGVVPTPGSDCTARLVMRPWSPVLPPELRALIEQTRETSTRPDGEPLDSWDLPDVLCQLCQGFYYIWDPLPPAWWLHPRRGWLAEARLILDARADGLDSEGQLAQALDRDNPHEVTFADGSSWAEILRVVRPLLAEWRAVKDRFVPNPVPVWVCPSVLEQAADCPAPTLIWTRHTAAGEQLERLGVPWYPGGTRPESHSPSESIALMISAHSTGRNLQAWSRSRVLVPPADSDAWEQLLGRTHRPGQLEDEVVGEYPDAIDYHRSVMKRVRSQADATSAASGFNQKLLDAEWQ
jgi:hypothetical protein